MHFHFGMGISLIAGSLLGCSSSNGADEGNAGQGKDGSAMSAREASGSGDDGGNAAYVGSVSANQTVSDGTYVGGFGAQFEVKQTVPAGAPTCTQATSGPCAFSDCTAVLESDGGGPRNVFVKAGNISINGGRLTSSTPLTYTTLPGNISEYYAPEVSQIFAPGDTFTITATGGDVAAFTGTSGPAPADIVLTAPTGTPGLAGAGTVYTIDESQNLVVTWTGGSVGTQVSVLMENNSSARQLSCAFDAAGGTGTVPTALLTKLGPNDGTLGSANGSAYFGVAPQSTTSIRVSNADVAFTVGGNGAFGSFKTE
jgi:hypothetical protein